MDYSKLSDFEINKLVALATKVSVSETHSFVNTGDDIDGHYQEPVLMREVTSNRKHWKLYAPCTSPADAWPIIVENKLSIYPSGERWGVEGFNADDPFYFDDNPLRAAMIVFLLMQEPAYVQANPARPDIR